MMQIRNDLAEKYLKIAVEKKEERAIEVLASLYMNKEDFTSAKKYLDTGVKNNSNLSMVLYAGIELYTGNYNEAQDYLNLLFNSLK